MRGRGQTVEQYIIKPQPCFILSISLAVMKFKPVIDPGKVSHNFATDDMTPTSLFSFHCLAAGESKPISGTEKVSHNF